ncbi:MAG: glycosyltransferase [bacterium]|nr:glycosyltransferase [bacterium]
MLKVRDSTIILVTHFLIYSASQALRDYLIQDKVNTLFFISHPLPQIDANKKEYSFVQVYEKGFPVKRLTSKKKFTGLLLPVITHFFLTIYWSLHVKKKADVFIGIDNVNAVAGILLKWFGRVRKVVYYTIDYFPTRYENPILNWAYHALDKFCVRYSDETWNVSPQMVSARKIHNLVHGKAFGKQFTVPIGIWYEKAPRKEYDPKRRFILTFVGHLVKHMGVDLVIRSLPQLIKEFPSIKLEVIGGGEELDNLKHLVKDKGVERNVRFYGWVKNRSRVERLLSTGGIGLATFNTDILDDKVKNADPAKIKDYMLLGLPVIATNAIANWQEIQQKRCGIIAKYSEKSFIKAVERLVKNEETYRRYRSHALDYVKQFDYNVLFSGNVKRILKK